MAITARWDLVRDMVEKGGDPNDNDKLTGLGFSALYWAIVGNNLDTVRFLLAHGAKADAKGCVLAAVRIGNIDILHLLLEQGANANEKGKNKRTALMDAVLYERADMIPLLLKHGAKIDAKDKNGHTAVMLAFISSTPEIAKLLVARGASMEGMAHVILWEMSISRYLAFSDIYQQSSQIRADYLNHQMREREAEKAAAELKAREETRLSLIRAGDVTALRDIFNQIFWQGKKPEVKAEEIKEALLTEQREVLRLLMIWGRKVSAADIDAWSNGDDALSKKYATALRQCGWEQEPPIPRSSGPSRAPQTPE